MSETDHTETVESAGAQEDTSSGKARRGINPRVVFAIIPVAVFGAIAWSFTSTPETNVGASSMPSGPAGINSTLGGDRQAESPRYREALQRANDQGAEDAQSRNTDFVAAPEVILEENDPLPDMRRPFTEAEEETETVEAEPEEAEPENVRARPLAIPAPPTRTRTTQDTTQVTRASAVEEEENPFVARMETQMRGVSSGFAPPAPSMHTNLGPTRAQEEAMQRAREMEEQRQAMSGGGESEAEVVEVASGGEPAIMAGDILYGEVVATVTSDQSQPVLARVTTGPMEGAVLRGSFQADPGSNGLLVSFDTLNVPGEGSFPISAYAVDGITAESAVSSSVNRRYLQRYGPILGAAFIGGYADARSETSQNTIITDGGIAVSETESAVEDSIFAGVRDAADVVADDLRSTAPQGAEIILRGGWPLGILFTETLNDASAR